MSTVTVTRAPAGSTATIRVNPTRGRWERAVPVYGVSVVTPFFIFLAGLAALGLLLTLYREIVGLGPVSGMTDKFAWGIWKTFNVVVLTAWGSGAFAVGIATWVLGRKRLHALMRMALLTSLLAYACGLMLLGIDVGRPWNFYWVAFPWNWNVHSPMAEVAICMSVYAVIPLALENIPHSWSVCGTTTSGGSQPSNASNADCINSFPSSLPLPTCCRQCTSRR